MKRLLFYIGIFLLGALPLAFSNDAVTVAEPVGAKAVALDTPTKAASVFFAACKAKDIDTLKIVISKRQQESLVRGGRTLEWFAGFWGQYNITSIDSSDPPVQSLDGKLTAKVNVKIATDAGIVQEKIKFALEGNEWKMDEN